jgi:ABC-type multidrug transport system ATPase subunit
MGKDGNPLVIGFAPDRFPKLRFTAREYLSHMAAIRGISKEEARSRIDAGLREFGLESYAELHIRHF